MSIEKISDDDIEYITSIIIDNLFKECLIISLNLNKAETIINQILKEELV
jgi:hypothetical protein